MRFGTEQQQPIDAFLHQRLQVTIHALLIAFGIAEHQAITRARSSCAPRRAPVQNKKGWYWP